MATRGKVRDILEILRKDGWIPIKANSGDHRQFKHPAKSGKVTVDGKPSKDVAAKLWKSMLQQTGLAEWEDAMQRQVLYGICKAGNSYNGYAPDFPGLLVAADTLEKVRERLPIALESHMRAMIEDNDPMPDSVEDPVEGGILSVDILEPAGKHS